jgi:hypothetical protein
MQRSPSTAADADDSTAVMDALLAPEAERALGAEE